MKHLFRIAVIVGLAGVGAGLTWWIKGPPDRGVPCDPAILKPDQICLSRVMAEWRDQVLWVDARSRAEWRRETVAGAALWNLDEGEDMQAFEAAVAMRLPDGRPAVVYGASEGCGGSRRAAADGSKRDTGTEREPSHVASAGLRRAT